MNWSVGGINPLFALIFFAGVWWFWKRAASSRQRAMPPPADQSLQASIGRYWNSLKAEQGFERFANWVGRLALINLAGFFALTNYFGGDALNGFESASGYFLKMGRRPPVEVSQALYEFMYWYAIVLICHWILAILLGFLLSRREKSALVYRSATD